MRIQTVFLSLLLVATAAFGQTPSQPAQTAASEKMKAATKITEEVVMRHMQDVLRGDVKGMLKDMGDPITIIGPNGPRVMSQAEFDKTFTPNFASQPRTFKVTRTTFAGNIGLVICTDNPGQPEEYQFAETFFVENGKIQGYSRVNFLPCPEGACKRVPAPAKK